MNIADNIKKIRKDNNLSQEQLAEKLGVSRQSVSKWEQGLAYPEMDKVLQICKLFNVGVDDLMQQDIREVQYKKESKNNFNKHVDSFFNYITKSVKMFVSLSTKDKIKCIFEQLFVLLVISLVVILFKEVLHTLFRSIFGSLPDKPYYIILGVFRSFFIIISTILSLVVFLHIFKVRYLDYFEEKVVVPKEEIKEEIKEEVKEENKIVNETKKEEKVIIRDPEDSSSSFLNGLLKILLYFVKFIAFWILFGICMTIIPLSMGLVAAFLVVGAKSLFFGIIVSILSSLLFLGILAYLLTGFIFNFKTKKGLLAALALLSIMGIGIGAGIFTFGLTKVNFKEARESDYIVTNLTYDMNEDTVINTHFFHTTYEVKDIPNIEVEVKHFKYEKISDYQDENYISIFTTSDGRKIENAIKSTLKDLNKYTIYDYKPIEIVIYANEYNINKLKENVKAHDRRYYNYDNVIEEYEDRIEEYEDRIEELEDKLKRFEDLGD